jgi:hypothetical protein
LINPFLLLLRHPEGAAWMRKWSRGATSLPWCMKLRARKKELKASHATAGADLADSLGLTLRVRSKPYGHPWLTPWS